jgi:autotransporter-associated beta strand protein
LVLSSKNTYVGSTVVSDGVLVAGVDGSLGTTAGGTTVQSGGTLAFRGSFTYATAEPLTLYGPGAQNGALALLSGNVTFSGPVTLASDATIWSGAGSTFTFTNKVAAVTYRLTVAGPGTTVFSGAFTGSARLFKIDTGVLKLTGSQANAFTGTTEVDGGTLVLQKTGTALQGNLIVGDGVSPPATAIAQIRAANQMPANTVVTVLTGGLLDLGGFSLPAKQNVSGGAVQGGSTTPVSLSNDVSLDSGSSTLVGNFTLSGARTFTIAQGASLTVTGAISGSGSITLRGGGTLILNGTTANTFTGAFTIYAGTVILAKTAGVNAIPGSGIITVATVPDAQPSLLQLGASNQIGDGATININRNGVFDLNGFNETIKALNLNGAEVTTGTGKLTLAGNVTNTSVASTITGNLVLGTGTHSFTPALDGVITIDGVISGAGSLQKAGAGQLILNGGPNTYTGTTAVSAGKLVINTQQPQSALMITGSGNVVLNGAVGSITNVGGILTIGPDGGTGTANGAISLSGTSTLNLTLNDADTPLTVTGKATLGATLNLTAGPGFSPAVGTKVTILKATSIATGTIFKGLAEGATVNVGGMRFKISYVGGSVTLTRVS